MREQLWQSFANHIVVVVPFGVGPFAKVLRVDEQIVTTFATVDQHHCRQLLATVAGANVAVLFRL